MEASATAISPILIRNFLATLFLIADKILDFLSGKSKLLEAFRYLLCASFVFFLRLLPSFFVNFIPQEKDFNNAYSFKPPNRENYMPSAVGGGIPGGAVAAVAGTLPDSGIARALSQLLGIANHIPVSSRKYEVVRSLAERLLDENLLERNEALREVNMNVLSAAFARTLSQLEAIISDQGRSFCGDVINATSDVGDQVKSLNRLVRVVRFCGDVLSQKGKSSDELSRSGSSAEKLAAELLWLAQKMEACGCADEAVHRWASVANLAWLSLTAEPRLQGSLVKISAFLFKQVRVLGRERKEENTKEQQRQTKVKILLLWIPLLCRASMGTDSPVLSLSERSELERILEDIIEGLEQQEDQEKVLALWIHHFTYCPSSDWPNLHGCYTRWCTQSRRDLLRNRFTK